MKSFYLIIVGVSCFCRVGAIASMFLCSYVVGFDPRALLKSGKTFFFSWAHFAKQWTFCNKKGFRRPWAFRKLSLANTLRRLMVFVDRETG